MADTTAGTLPYGYDVKVVIVRNFEPKSIVVPYNRDVETRRQIFRLLNGYKVSHDTTNKSGDCFNGR